MSSSLRPRLIAEWVGTFALVFAGTGAIVTNDLSAGAVTHVGIALTFGLVVMAMIYAVGPISGAHFNPAVSLGFWMSGRFSGRDLLAYVVVQLVAAVSASGLLRLLFPGHLTLGLTTPAGAVEPAFAFEVIATALLVFVILCVATGAKEQGMMAGAAIGGTVAFCALFAGPVSGASMNPARSLGPAFVAGKAALLWVYLIAPSLGAVVASGLFRSIGLNDGDRHRS